MPWKESSNEFHLWQRLCPFSSGARGRKPSPPPLLPKRMPCKAATMKSHRCSSWPLSLRKCQSISLPGTGRIPRIGLINPALRAGGAEVTRPFIFLLLPSPPPRRAPLPPRDRLYRDPRRRIPPRCPLLQLPSAPRHPFQHRCKLPWSSWNSRTGLFSTARSW